MATPSAGEPSATTNRRTPRGSSRSLTDTCQGSWSLCVIGTPASRAAVFTSDPWATRTGGAPIMIGGALLLVALLLGASLSAILAGFPLPILAGLLAVSGLLHIALLRDLHRPTDWTFAVATGIVGFLTNLAIALVAALLVWWLARAAGVVRDHANA